jgi:cytidylate kinase
VADRPVFREAVNALLRGMTNVVADGRDMGSVVFPNASYKYYLEASVDIRAARRAAENEARGWKEDLGEIKESIRKRDEEDEKREYGALIRTPDMILIDTGPLNLEGVIGRILNSLQIKF